MRTFYVFLTLIGLGFSFYPQMAAQALVQDALVKNSGQSAVYYVLDGKRYVFPTESVYKSWYSDFSQVRTVSDAELASYPISGTVSFRPGSTLVKVQTDPKVYAVANDAVLRWVENEAVAKALYGDAWAKRVVDFSDAFFFAYRIGAPIKTTQDYSVQGELSIMTLYQWYKGVAPVASGTTFQGCPVFPADNAWNQRVDQLAVHPLSSTYISSIGTTRTLHPDFGENQSYGIPFTTANASTPLVPIRYVAYGDESDAGPFPIPSNAKIEGGSDRHVLVVDTDACMLYELFAATKTATGWDADSGAKWNLKTGALRPEGWTSADAAGLPIFHGLVKYDEVASGKITHAIRVTVPRSQKGHILPATHHAGTADAKLPPMGLRLRMKADYDLSKLTGSAKIIAQAMKEYGLIVADNGSAWYFQGATDPRWNDDELNQLKAIPGSAFEAVQTGDIRK